MKLVEDKIYIGGYFLDSTIIWVFHIIVSYALKKNIKTIIIEDNYSLTTIEDLKKIAPNNLNIIFNFNHKKNVPFGFHFIKVKDF